MADKPKLKASSVRTKDGQVLGPGKGGFRASTAGKTHENSRPHMFQPGNPGRPKGVGVRPTLTKKFLGAVLKDFEEYGQEAIAAARAESPLGYCRMVASLLPTKIEGPEGKPPTKWTDAELMQLIEAKMSERAEEDERQNAQIVEPNVPGAGRA